MTDWHSTPDFLRAPNISDDSGLYEIENLAADPDGTVEWAMRAIAPWNEKVVLDLGAGTGFHLDRFHREAAHVIAVEPDSDLRLKMMQRVASQGLSRVSVLGASAADLPLRDHSVDIAHARFAYFFGPGCEPGIAELQRVLRPGGTAFIIDNDLTSSTFARWVRSAYDYPEEKVAAIERFWIDRGFTIKRLESCWRFADRDAFERVMYLEFPRDDAKAFLADHQGLEVDYNLLLIHKTFPDTR